MPEDAFPSLKDHDKLKEMHEQTLKIYGWLSRYAEVIKVLRTISFMQIDIEKVYTEISQIERDAQWG